MRKQRLFILIVAVFGGSTTLYAQMPLMPMTSVATASTAAAPEADAVPVRLMVGRSTLVDVSTPISRVSLTSPDVADALVTAPTQLLINGKVPGTISMFVWDRAGGIRRYEVVVQRDLARLNEQVKQLFPGESIDVMSNGRNIVLSGQVSRKEVIDHVINVAAGYVDKKEEVVSLLSIQEGGASNQVLLRVRFAEVNRSALTELGSSFFTGATGYKDYVARSATQQFPAPAFDNDEGGLVFSDYLNLFLFDIKRNVGTVIKALQTRGLFQSLAEPNLVAESGKEASFLAGGEIPVPIAQGSGTSMAISVQYKEFGIRLSFLPTVTGNRVHLKVKPEVSTLDFTNAVVLNGFRIPALSTRRTETELELQNGQTFAIAGLINNSVNEQISKIPGIGDIPILGLLFKSKSAQKNKTELVIMITPEILPNNSVGVTGTLPRTPEQYLPALPDRQSHEPPPPAFRQGAVAPPPATPAPVPVTAAPAPVAPNATAAAAAMSALTPQTRSAVTTNAAMSTGAPVTAAPASAAAAPGSATSGPAAAATPATAVTRPMTDAEKKVLERARKQEEQAKVAAAKQAARQAIADREKAKKDAELKAKQDRERAKVEAEAARVAAQEAKRNAEAEAKRQKAQQEAEAKRQKALAEADAKLKAAEAVYKAELARQNGSR
jgi:pilus assembly protein CpaC